MTIGLVGRKCGMTRIFTEEGVSIPVSVIEVLPNRVVQVKTLEGEGYQAIQVTTGSRKQSKVNKPLAGHYAKAGVAPGRLLMEFRLSDQEEVSKFEAGAELTVDRFQEGQYVDVAGITRGKGFAGTIKRHHFSSQDATHGNSLSHRAPGSIGQRQTPGRVFKGKRMSGHLGNAKRTILSQQIARVDKARNLILLKGSIPGAPGSSVVIRPAIKKPIKHGETK